MEGSHFWTKCLNPFNQVNSFNAYANAFLNLYKKGHDTPINLEGTLRPERYKFGDHIISGTQRFTGNGEINTFLIEKEYEEMLLAHGRKFQRQMQSFMKDFITKMAEGGIKFTEPHFVDYNVLIA